MRIYDSVPIPVAIYNDLDNSITVNKKFTEIFGYTDLDIKVVDDWWNLCIQNDDNREKLKTEWNRRYKNTIKNNIPFAKNRHVPFLMMETQAMIIKKSF